jgi:hypothetical protein
MTVTRRRGWLVASLAMTVSAAVEVAYWIRLYSAVGSRDATQFHAALTAASGTRFLCIAVATIAMGATVLRLRNSVYRRLGATSGVCLLVGGTSTLLFSIFMTFGLPVDMLPAVKQCGTVADFVGWILLAVLLAGVARGGVPQVRETSRTPADA